MRYFGDGMREFRKRYIGDMQQMVDAWGHGMTLTRLSVLERETHARSIDETCQFAHLVAKTFASLKKEPVAL